jgi:hypothetical protein
MDEWKNRTKSNEKEKEQLIKVFKKELNSRLSILDKKIEQKSDIDNTFKFADSIDRLNNIKYNNTYIIENSKINPKNFLLDYKLLIKILEEYGLKRSNDPKGNHMFGIINEDYYNTQFYLLNNFENIDSFDEKYNLYFNLKLHFPTHYFNNYPNSFMLSSILTWNDIKNRIYIARPIAGLGGEGIILIHNPETLKEAQTLLIKKYSNQGISLTEYITNPLLIEGRKLHLRAYMLFTLINNTFKSYLLDSGWIITAKSQYENTDWNNKDIHDTHLQSTTINGIVYPNDLYGRTTPNIKDEKDFEKIDNNMRECVKYISSVAASNIYNFNNAANTYEVYGLDFFIRDDFSTFIMEINSKYVGYKDFPKVLEKKYFEWIHENVIKPCLFPQLENIKNKSNTPIFEVEIDDY